MERIWHAHVAIWLLIFFTTLILSVNGEPSHVGRSLKAVIAGKRPVKKPPVSSGSAAKFPLGYDNVLLRPPPKPPSVNKLPGKKPEGNGSDRGEGGKRVNRRGRQRLNKWRRGRKGKRIGRKGRNGKKKPRKGLGRKGQKGKKRKGRKGYFRRGGKKRKGRKRNWRGRKGQGGKKGKGKFRKN